MRAVPNMRWMIGAWFVALSLVLGCGKSGSRNEPPITGKAGDPAVALQQKWEPGKRYIYRTETTANSRVPRKNTGEILHAETTIGQDLAFAVTNGPAEGTRILTMQLLAVQMETGREDGATYVFDSANRVMVVEDTTLTQKLKKLVGLKLTFHVSADNRVTRVDGVSDLNDRMSAGGQIRGVAGNLFQRQFSQAFYREVVEVGLLPKDPVKVGEKWTVNRQVMAGVWAASANAELEYQFRGWQSHAGTNCARIDFTGSFKPPTPDSRTNQNNIRRVLKGQGPTPSNLEQGELSGTSWFNPEINMAVETIYDQSISTKSTTVRRVRTAGGTNEESVVMVDSASVTNLPPPPTNGPPPVVTTNTTSTHQRTVVKLIDVESPQK